MDQLSPRSQDQGREGFTLLAVLACLAILSVSLETYTRSVMTSVKFSKYVWTNTRDFGIAASFGASAMQRVGEPLDPAFWRTPTEFGCSINGLKIWMSIRNHRGLIDINSADETLISEGFRALGVNKALSKEAAREFLQARNMGQSNTPLPTLSKDLSKGPYLHASVISLVRPLEEIQYWDISDVFTTYSRTSYIDIGLSSNTLKYILQSHSNENRKRSAQSPFFTFRVAFANNRKIIDSWILEYEVSGDTIKQVAIITGDVFDRTLPNAQRSCSEIIPASILDAAKEIVE